jgi:hypothetical protein
MLAKGIQLTLLMGPVVPVPAPRVVMDALDSVTVTTTAGSPSGFQLSFQFSSKSELNTIFIIAAGEHLNGVVARDVVVTLNGRSCFDGVIINVNQVGSGGLRARSPART